jgi:membrane associated rhomboid family serine protease
VTQRSEPILNVPAVVLALLALFFIVHAVRDFLLTPDQDLQFLLLFAFIPARYDSALLLGGTLPGGVGAQVWSFVTYAFIHADWTHIAMNSVWFLPFGTAVARRFGTLRFLAFFAATAACGAAAHLAAHPGELLPVIGASASVSGMMAASMRFAFQPGGPLRQWSRWNEPSYQIPAAPLSAALRDPQVLIFVGVWFGLNLLFGLGSFPIAGANQTVAWEAHVGGFLGGLLLFSLFDPVPARAAGGDGGDSDGEMPH